jgi:hypothetical protein
MSHYIHHLPGRLRVKSPHIKRNAHRADEARRHFSGLDGVLSAEASTVTGSLLITYDVNRVGAETLLASLRHLGHVAGPDAQPGMPIPSDNPMQRLSDSVVNKLVETAIERSATALIAAIL